MSPCVENGSFALGVLWASCGLIAVCFMIWAAIFHSYHYYRIPTRDRTSKSLFILGNVYNVTAICCVIVYISNAIYWTLTCNQPSRWFYTISIGLYGNQEWFFMLVLFVRLYKTFKDSNYRLSNCSVFLFIAMFILLPLSASILMYMLRTDAVSLSVILILVLLCASLSLTVMLSLSFAFLYKLYVIFKSAGADVRGSGFLSMITRNTILVVISISFSFLNVVSFALVNYYSDTDRYGTSSFGYIQNFMFLFDVCTNFTCVMLTLNAFTKYYYGVCGPLDAKCRTCCGNVTKVKKEKSKDIELGSTSATSTQ